MRIKTILCFGVDMRYPTWTGGAVVIFWSVLITLPIAIVLKAIILTLGGDCVN